LSSPPHTKPPPHIASKSFSLLLLRRTGRLPRLPRCQAAPDTREELDLTSRSRRSRAGPGRAGSARRGFPRGRRCPASARAGHRGQKEAPGAHGGRARGAAPAGGLPPLVGSQWPPVPQQPAEASPGPRTRVWSAGRMRHSPLAVGNVGDPEPRAHLRLIVLCTPVPASPRPAGPHRPTPGPATRSPQTAASKRR
jgi:hypothetical protein